MGSIAWLVAAPQSKTLKDPQSESEANTKQRANQQPSPSTSSNQVQTDDQSSSLIPSATTMSDPNMNLTQSIKVMKVLPSLLTASESTTVVVYAQLGDDPALLREGVVDHKIQGVSLVLGRYDLDGRAPFGVAFFVAMNKRTTQPVGHHA